MNRREALAALAAIAPGVGCILTGKIEPASLTSPRVVVYAGNGDQYTLYTPHGARAYLHESGDLVIDCRGAT